MRKLTRVVFDKRVAEGKIVVDHEIAPGVYWAREWKDKRVMGRLESSSGELVRIEIRLGFRSKDRRMPNGENNQA